MKMILIDSPRNFRVASLCVLTLVGLVFAFQLRFHYEVPWPTSIFWGLSDWYLWGILAAAMVAVARKARNFIGFQLRTVAWIMAAPVVISIHVVLTIVVGTIIEPVSTAFDEAFRGLFAKKLTLNLVTYAVLALIAEGLARNPNQKKKTVLAKRGDESRFLDPKEIIFARALGNYVRMATDDGHWLIRSTLGNSEELLGPEFIKTSRSELVNIGRVTGYREKSPHLILLLSDGAELRVAKRRRAMVRKELQGRSINVTR